MVEPEIQKSVALFKILKARQNVLVTHFKNQAGRKIKLSNNNTMQHMDFKIVGGKEVIWKLAGVRRGRESGKFPFINACHAGYLVLHSINFVRACKSIKVMFTLHRITLRVHTKT